jgi:hypothetical protein
MKDRSALTKQQAIKALWEAHDASTKALRDLQGNIACESLQTSLWEAKETASNNLKWIRNLTAGEYYKVEDYDYDKSYYICRLETFTPNDYSIACWCRLLTSSKSKVEYNDITDWMLLPISRLHDHQFELVEKDLPLYVGNAFTGTLLQELLSKGAGNEV